METTCPVTQNRNRIVYLGGVRGVGKSRLLRTLRDYLIDENIAICDFSSLLEKRFQEMTGLSCFRGYEETTLYDSAVNACVSEVLRLQPIIVAGHYFFHANDVRRVYERPFLEISPCIAFIHLVCFPQQLVFRLRSRGVVRTPSSMAEEMDYSRRIASDLSIKCNTPLYELSNDTFANLRNNAILIKQWFTNKQ